MSHIHGESLKICNGCGEIFDANIQSEELHHNTPKHAPSLPPRSEKRYFCAPPIPRAA